MSVESLNLQVLLLLGSPNRRLGDASTRIHGFGEDCLMHAYLLVGSNRQPFLAQGPESLTMLCEQSRRNSRIDAGILLKIGAISRVT